MSSSLSPDTPTHLPPSFGSPGLSVTYVSQPLCLASSAPAEPALGSSAHQLTVTVPPASISQIFAHRQWRAGMILADAIAAQALPAPQLKGKRVLELGAGTALPGMMAALAGGAGFVVLSDYDESTLMSTLRANAKTNIPPELMRSRVRVSGHIWGTDVGDLLDCLPIARPPFDASRTTALPPAFDAILLADCLWDALSHQALLRTLSKTLARTSDARVYVVAGLHTGRETLVSFIRRSHRAGLRLAPLGRARKHWPSFDSAADTTEHKVDEEQEEETEEEGEDDALAHAKERILELEVCGTETAKAVSEAAPSTAAGAPVLPTATPAFTSASPAATSDSGAQQAGAQAQAQAQAYADLESRPTGPRLSGVRRVFEASPGQEEIGGGVRVRNRWITFFTLKWDKADLAGR